MPKNKIKKTQPDKSEAVAQPSVPVTTTIIDRTGEPFPPHILLDEALKEPPRRELRDYADTIRVLRDQKNFTFREIAEWLGQYHVETDHNAVYREYTKGMPEDIAQGVAIDDEHLEDEEAGRA